MIATNIVKSFNVNQLLSVYKEGVFEDLSINLVCSGCIPSKEWLACFKNGYYSRGNSGDVSWFISGNNFIVIFVGVNLTSDLLVDFLKSVSGLIETVNFRLRGSDDTSVDPDIKRDIAYHFSSKLLNDFIFNYSGTED